MAGMPLRKFSPVESKVIRPTRAKVSATVVETPDSIVIACDVPGVKKDDVQITIKDTVLTVAGYRKSSASSNDTILFEERLNGNFSRSFRIPESIDTSQINAKQTDGVLEITMMKKPEKKPLTIPIS